MRLKTAFARTGGVAIALVLLLSLVLAVPALAADIREGDTIVIAAGEVIDDDLFAAGNRVEVNGTVKGDLFAVGQTVIINGRVEGSLFIAGQTLAVDGPVEGSLYAGGYSLEIGSETDIARNLYFGGFSLATEAGSAIGRSLYGGSYQFLLDGEVADDVSVSGAALELNGKVGGDLTGEVSQPDESGAPPTFVFPGAVPAVEPGLRIGDEAEIGGEQNVRLVAPSPSDRHQPSVTNMILRAIGRRVGEFVALMIVGGLLLWLWPDMVNRIGDTLRAQLLPSAGHGLVVFVAFWLLVVLAGLVVILAALVSELLTFGQLGGRVAMLGGGTIYLSVAGFLFVVALVTKMIVAFVTGRLVLERLAPQTMEGRWGVAVTLVAGVVIYELIRAVPLLGFIVAVLVTLAGLGAIYLSFRPTAGTAASLS
ncbi:MAG: polymer-forming cytoskeletal protein [Anaerolineales bacterium]